METKGNMTKPQREGVSCSIAYEDVRGKEISGLIK
jgi:hypothetical protein